jgi:hypothetical protein
LLYLRASACIGGENFTFGFARLSYSRPFSVEKNLLRLRQPPFH